MGAARRAVFFASFLGALIGAPRFARAQIWKSFSTAAVIASWSGCDHQALVRDHGDALDARGPYELARHRLYRLRRGLGGESVLAWRNDGGPLLPRFSAARGPESFGISLSGTPQRARAGPLDLA
jgi:hypothetical protein